jgi:hypothetical protein
MSDFKNPSNGSGGAAWGDITGTLSSQTDLQAALPTAVTWTLTGAWSTNTTYSTRAFVQTVGSNIWMGGTLVVSTSGQPTNASLSLSMVGSGYKLDPLYVLNQTVFYATFADSVSIYHCHGTMVDDVTIQLYTLSLNPVASCLRAENPINRTNPKTWDAGDSLICHLGMWVVAA